MTPEPVIGLLTDGVFQKPDISPCQFAFRQLAGVIGDSRQLDAITSAPDLVNTDEDHGNIADARTALRSPDKGGRPAEEIQPIGVLGSARRLIGYQCQDILLIAIGKEGPLHPRSGQRDRAGTASKMKE